MDRLETKKIDDKLYFTLKFTFQYGQIRNYLFTCKNDNVAKIYIPVWIDQKLISPVLDNLYISNLHSSMDRLETYFFF